jgi:hypothetical protein
VPDNVNPSYYIFNYVGGGFVIMPADKRVEPIFAYSNNGYFPHSGTLPSGLGNWLSVNHKNMQLLRKDTTLKVTPGVAKLWAELATSNSVNTGNKVINVTQPPPPPPSSCQPTYSIQTVGPLLQTAWAQGYPYDLLCPPGAYYYSLNQSQSPAGCVATAMAQVMYYWKAPTYFNWSAMPLTSISPGDATGNNAVAGLMSSVGLSVNMAYGATESDPSNGFLDPGISCTFAFKNEYHYSSSTEGSYDYLSVLNNLNASEPVLLSASTDNHTFLFWNWYYLGHEWVCDGYQQIYTTWCPSGDSPGGGEGFLYLHMNWGWNELNVPYDVDGWFPFDQWDVDSYGDQENYQYNQSMTYNIHP